MSLEQHFNKLSDDKRKGDEDYKARLDSNLVFIANLRTESDDLKSTVTDKKKQNSDLSIELDRQKDTLD